MTIQRQRGSYAEQSTRNQAPRSEHTQVYKNRKHCSRLLKWISIRIRVPNELSQRLLKRNAHAGQSLANEFSLSAASASLDNQGTEHTVFAPARASGPPFKAPAPFRAPTPPRTPIYTS